MKIKKSVHFDIFYLKNSLAEKEIDFITDSLENSYNYVLKQLRLKDNFPKIQYRLYPDNKFKLQKMGDFGNANAAIKEFAIYGIYNDKIKIVGRHEIVHLLTANWGRPPELFRQGLAEAMEPKWHNLDHRLWVKKFSAEGKLIPLNILLDDKVFWLTRDLITYPESGSFVKFLIENYGLEKIKLIYRKMLPDLSIKEKKIIFKNIFGKVINTIEQQWLLKVLKNKA